MHLTAKEEHQKKLNEVERCYATIASQFGMVKGVHGKLEHSGMCVLNVLQFLLCFDSMKTPNNSEKEQLPHVKQQIQQLIIIVSQHLPQWFIL